MPPRLDLLLTAMRSSPMPSSSRILARWLANNNWEQDHRSGDAQGREGAGGAAAAVALRAGRQAGAGADRLRTVYLFPRARSTITWHGNVQHHLAHDSIRPGMSRQARRDIADCDARLRQHRAALEAGADPKIITSWMAETQLRRAAAETGSSLARLVSA
jgi:hypothetical protein